MMSAEAFVKYASRHYNKEFGKFKVYFDITLVTLATPNGEEIEEPVGIQQFWIVFFLFFMTGLPYPDALALPGPADLCVGQHDRVHPPVHR